MGRYAARRLLQFIPVMLGTTFMIYLLVWRLPGDPFAGRCGDRPCSDAYIAKMTDEFNLDDPLVISYAKYLWNLLRGDLGVNFNQVPVMELVSQSYPTTLRLAAVAVVIEGIIGIGAGVLTGLKRGGFLDNLVLISSLFLLSIPVFVTGFMLQYILSLKFHLINPTVTPPVSWSELIVPGFVLASLSMAFVARLTRTNIAENARADYVRTATAKGLTRRRVVGVHLLRNSMIPVVTYLGTDLGSLMSGAIVTEGIFNINGIGGTLFRAISLKDASVVVPIATLLVLVYLAANLIVDLLYGVLDPRIRYD